MPVSATAARSQGNRRVLAPQRCRGRSFVWPAGDERSPARSTVQLPSPSLGGKLFRIGERNFRCSAAAQNAPGNPRPPGSLLCRCLRSLGFSIRPPRSTFPSGARLRPPQARPDDTWKSHIVRKRAKDPSGDVQAKHPSAASTRTWTAWESQLCNIRTVAAKLRSFPMRLLQDCVK